LPKCSPNGAKPTFGDLRCGGSVAEDASIGLASYSGGRGDATSNR
jgi:hypothetical protein